MVVLIIFKYNYFEIIQQFCGITGNQVKTLLMPHVSCERLKVIITSLIVQHEIGTINSRKVTQTFKRNHAPEDHLLQTMRSSVPELRSIQLQDDGNCHRSLVLPDGLQGVIFINQGGQAKDCRAVSHNLTTKQVEERVKICKELHANPQDQRFNQRIVTSDEKWIYLRNPNKLNLWLSRGKPAQPVVKRKSFETKVMLCVWWNYEGVFHFELVPDGRAMNSKLYC